MAAMLFEINLLSKIEKTCFKNQKKSLIRHFVQVFFQMGYFIMILHMSTILFLVCKEDFYSKYSLVNHDVV